MTGLDGLLLAPFLILTAGALFVLLAISFRRSHPLASGISIAAFALAFGSLLPLARLTPQRLTELLLVDRFALFYMGLLLAAGLAVALLSYGYLERRDVAREEFYAVLLLASLGSLVLVASDHFASFFLGLELLSVSLYVLIAYLRSEARALEAGLKYLVLAAASSSFLLFGMALIYAELGTMSLGRMSAMLAAPDEATGLRWTGLALMFTGIGFKLAVVPFHMWTPDVYQGAPAPVTAFIATVSKGAMFALLLRYGAGIDVHSSSAAVAALAAIAAASMFVGNLLALKQDNVKRILAYSSIAHLGYLLVAFLAGGEIALEAVSFYLVAYFATTLGAFGVVGFLSSEEKEAEALEDYRGLFWRRPGIAAIFTVMLLSLAGIPLTAGFLAKFYVIAAGIHASFWLLVFVLVINSAIGLYYYLRITVTMLYDAAPAPPQTAPRLAPALLAALLLVVIWLGVFPAFLVRIIGVTAGHLLG